MTPFPPSEKLAFLLEGDSSISQIVINATSVSFLFANDCRIDAGVTLEYVSEDGVRTIHDREWFDEGPVNFHRLLETPLRKIETNHLTMTLTFEGGRQLIVHSDLQPYEAGAVLGPKDSRLGFYF
ncbi:hypothetical protein [uncultured Brevundimonas sp.]|uniref:hypothetical protein n=1 Tax=uncultured Brevundimonas sp. TaxID=213418 RepID=UPI002618D404|nr:hypothetical protein [uncultured Brevundimonas sp.]